MSDIGIDFPIWVFVGLILAYALPVTTALLAPLVFARVSASGEGRGGGHDRRLSTLPSWRLRRRG